MNTGVTTPTNDFGDPKFLLYKIAECPGSYLKSIKREEFFEIIWFEPINQKDSSSTKAVQHIYLIPPFRGLALSLEDKKGYIISFKREYLEEDDKEYALDVFKLFNLQGQYSLITLNEITQQNINHVYELILFEYQNPSGSFQAIKALLKVFLLHLIRLNQQVILNQDVNQKRVYEFCMLLDQNYNKERKASFYSSHLGISEKRLNQILMSKMSKTITQLVHSRLILEAKRKLISGELTIKEISFALHFEDHSYFSRFFKKQTGLSPEDFKKKVVSTSPLPNFNHVP